MLRSRPWPAEFAAKQKRMLEKNAQTKPSDLTPRLTRTTLLLRRLRAALQGRAGLAPSYMEMEEWTGVAEGTLKDWFNNKGRPTAEFLLQLLDRTPDEVRHHTLAATYQAWPTRANPRLKCDQTVLSQLKTILCQSNGLSFIQGGSAEARTFLLTALAHSFLAMTERPRRVAGFDVHEADWFVLVPGLTYLHNVFHPALLRQALRQGWKQVGSNKVQLICLNGIWTVLPEMQKEILAMAARFPVVVADAATIDPYRLEKELKAPANLVTVSQDPNTGSGILIAIQAL